MIAAKLIFQSLAGVGAIAAVAGGGSYLATQKETKPENYSYLLVKASTKDSSQTEILAKSIKERNYYCEITNNKNEKLRDSFCEIFKSYVHSTNNLQEIDLSLINQEHSLLKNNNDLVTNKNYFLKINKEKYSQEIKEIAIIGTKKLGTLTPVFEFKKDITDLSTNLIIVQATKNLVSTAVNFDPTKKTVCSFGSKTEKFDCDLYKPSTDKTTNNLSSSDLQNSSKITTTSEIKANHFYVLDLKDKEYARSDFSNKQLKIFHQTVPNNVSVSTDTEITPLNFSQLVLGNLQENPKIAFPITSHIQTYIVKVQTEKDASLTTELIDSEVKNYTCILNVIKETSCELFQIGFDATKASISLPSIPTSLTRETSKDKLKTGKLFKLEINKKIADNLLFSTVTSQTIDLVSKEEPTKKYATLTLDYKLTNSKPKGVTRFALVKPATGTAINNSITFPTSFKCKLSSSSNTEACDIYKFSTTPTVKASLKFSELTPVTDKSDIAAANFLTIDLKSKKINLSKVSTSISVFASSSTTTKIFEAKIDTEFIANISTPKKFSEVITIK